MVNLVVRLTWQKHVLWIWAGFFIKSVLVFWHFYQVFNVKKWILTHNDHFRQTVPGRLDHVKNWSILASNPRKWRFCPFFRSGASSQLFLVPKIVFNGFPSHSGKTFAKTEKNWNFSLLGPFSGKQLQISKNGPQKPQGCAKWLVLAWFFTK